MNIKYQDISDAMREKIRSGVWGPGQRLPIRSELVKQYNTTVATLQKAMDELSADGFIISAGKRGTFVANEPPNLSTFAVVFQEAAFTVWEDTLWTIFVSQKRRLEKQFKLKFNLYHIEENNMTSEDFLRLTADARFQRLAGVIFRVSQILYDGSVIGRSASLCGVYPGESAGNQYNLGRLRRIVAFGI